MLSSGKAASLKVRNSLGIDVMSFSFTELCDAAASGETWVLGELIAEDSSLVNQADRYGCTPLHAACVAGKVEATKLLLSHGADIRASTKLSLIHI